MAKLAPIFNDAQLISGIPASGAKLFTYLAGSTTKTNTYTDITGTIPQSNPILLNSRGEPASPIWLTEGIMYKFVFSPSTDSDPPASPIRTIDDISGINDTSVTIDQWVASGSAPTYVSATTFTLAGDQTSDFHVGRRVKLLVTAGTVYGVITVSSYAALTTITVDLDSGVLDSGLSQASLGLITSVHTSAPILTDEDFLVSGSVDKTKKINFDVDSNLQTNTTRTMKTQDANLTIAGIENISKYISGMIISNNVADVVNDIDISAGTAIDSTGVTPIILSAITKRLDATWAVGTNQGGLDTGAIGNSDYYIWAIKRSDTGITDALFSLSSTAPTMPANYDFKRLIGWIKRVAGVIVLFHAYEASGGGLDYRWDSPTLEVDLTNTLTTTARTDALKVPLNFSVKVDINAYIADASPSSAYISCPDNMDLAPGPAVAPLATISATAGASSRNLISGLITSSAGLIRSRGNIATVDNYAISTIGFVWNRRN